jgi:methyl-accepting chemotaxis protein
MARKINNGKQAPYGPSGVSGVGVLEMAEESSQELSHQDIASFFDLVPSPVFVMDLAHTVLYINDEATRFFGRTREECLGKKYWDLIDCPGCREGTCAASRSIKTGVVCSGETVGILRGQKMNLRVMSAPRFGRNHQVVGCVQLIVDSSFEAVVSDYLQKISNGEIPAKITDELHGSYDKVKTSMNMLVEVVTTRTADIQAMAEAMAAGNLSYRPDPNKYTGYNGKMIAGMNRMLDGATGPLYIAAKFLDQISKGEIPQKITESYIGDFNTIKNNMNACVDGLASLQECDEVLKRMAVNDYTLQVEGNAPGVFGEMARATNDVHSRITHLASTVTLISKGDLTDLPAYRKIGRRSERDVLVPALIQLMESLKALVDDATMLAKAAVDGKLSARADAGKHQGDYRNVVEGVNATLDAVIGPLNVAADYVDKISRGAIPAKITAQYNGDFNTIKNNLNNCIDAINLLVADAGVLVKAAVEGSLGVRADASKHEGDYRKIVEGVNQTLDAVLEPIQEAATVIEQIASQDLRARVEGKYRGDHAAIKENINRMGVDLHNSIQQIAQSASVLASASEELTASSHQMAGNAEETATQANVVSAAAEQVSKNVSVVATGADQMQTSIREIARSANEAAKIAKNAVRAAETTNQTIGKLGDSSLEIGKVIKVITSIAQQTNLLALNATIEAARAGEAGKGFAVVANEVKELAKETAKATEDIGQKIEAIQSDTKGAVQAIAEIGAVINQVNDISNTIASAVEEQTVTTNEIGRNVAEAARGTSDIAKNISGVALAAQNTTQGASDSQKAASSLAAMASQLQAIVSKFKL